MAFSVSVFSDRHAFIDAWRTTLGRVGLHIEACAPTTLSARTEKNSVIIIDGAWTGFTEDELLAAAGFARALGATPIVVLPNAHAFADIAGLIDEVCAGLVCVDTDGMARIANVLARYVDATRNRRFEYLTVAPRGTDLLAIVGDGRATVIQRPLDGTDDGSDVREIILSDDATTAVVELVGGPRITLQALSIAPSIPPADFGTTMDVDGVKLGARLRSLRVQAGLTQAELARRTGIHRPNIARVEAGRHTPSLETLARLAQAIGVPTTRVFGQD